MFDIVSSGVNKNLFGALVAFPEVEQGRQWGLNQAVGRAGQGRGISPGEAGSGDSGDRRATQFNSKSNKTGIQGRLEA